MHVVTDVEVTAVFNPPAARLRLRKGTPARYWSSMLGSEEFRVVSVSMPDESGRVRISLERT